MYVPNNPSQLSGIFSKIKKKIDKVLPKELSPTRIIKSAAKRKATIKNLKTQVSETQRAAANEVENVKTAAAVEVLQAKATPSVSSVAAPNFSIPSPTPAFSLNESVPAQMNPVASVAPTAPTSAVASDNTALYVGIGAAGLLGLYFLMGKRK
jgi:hypothetical protein